MTLQQQHLLEQDLDAAVSDAELLAKQIIGNGIRFLAEAHRLSPWEIRVVLEEVISDLELPAHVDDYHVAMRAGIRLVN
jgi:hypothetical protein